MKEFCKDKIFIDEIPQKFFGMQLGTRMTVIRLANKKLFRMTSNFWKNKFIFFINKCKWI